jgi:hypothetical protein
MFASTLDRLSLSRGTIAKIKGPPRCLSIASFGHAATFDTFLFVCLADPSVRNPDDMWYHTNEGAQSDQSGATPLLIFGVKVSETPNSVLRAGTLHTTEEFD